MPRTYRSHDTTQLGKPLKSESGLDKQRKTDDYSREKRFKDFVLLMSIILTVFITLAFMIDYLTNPKSRDFVLGLIQQNAVGIVFFVLYVLGVSWKNKE